MEGLLRVCINGSHSWSYAHVASVNWGELAPRWREVGCPDIACHGLQTVPVVCALPQFFECVL